MLPYTHWKLKHKIHPVYVMKLYRKSRLIAPIILKFSVSGVISQVHNSDALSPEKDPQAPIDQAVGWTPELVLKPGRAYKSLAPSGNRKTISQVSIAA